MYDIFFSSFLHLFFFFHFTSQLHFVRLRLLECGSLQARHLPTDTRVAAPKSETEESSVSCLLPHGTVHVKQAVSRLVRLAPHRRQSSRDDAVWNATFRRCDIVHVSRGGQARVCCVSSDVAEVQHQTSFGCDASCPP